VANTNTGNILWNVKPLETSTLLWTVGAGDITVKEAGLYMYSAMVSSATNADNSHIEITATAPNTPPQVAKCFSTNSGSLQHTFCFSEIVNVSANSAFRVQYKPNGAFSTIQNVNATLFSLIPLPIGTQVLVLSSNLVAPNPSLIQWNDTKIPNSSFTLTANNAQINFTLTGTYLIMVNVAVKNNGSGGYIALKVNNSEVCKCFMTESNNFIKNCAICQAVQVNAGQYINVYSTANSGTFVDGDTSQRLSVLRLN